MAVCRSYTFKTSGSSDEASSVKEGGNSDEFTVSIVAPFPLYYSSGTNLSFFFDYLVLSAKEGTLHLYEKHHGIEYACAISQCTGLSYLFYGNYQQDQHVCVEVIRKDSIGFAPTASGA